MLEVMALLSFGELTGSVLSTYSDTATATYIRRHFVVNGLRSVISCIGSTSYEVPISICRPAAYGPLSHEAWIYRFSSFMFHVTSDRGGLVPSKDLGANCKVAAPTPQLMYFSSGIYKHFGLRIRPAASRSDSCIGCPVSVTSLAG